MTRYIDIGRGNALADVPKIRFCEKRKRWIEITIARWGDDALVYEKEIEVISGEKLLDRKAK